MRRFALLCEEFESRPEEGDRVAVLARYLREVGREAGRDASEWVLHLAEGRHARRPVRVPLVVLAAAAKQVAAAAGLAPWLFEAGCAAEPETAEAISLLLPWPEAPWRPVLGEWLDAWRAAIARAPAGERGHAVAWTIARLDDALSRRWAVRAACGLVRPLVEEGAWLRAWSIAFEEDPYALAWRWHAQGRVRAMAAAAPRADEVAPRPRPFVAAVEVAAEAAEGHAALLEALAAAGQAALLEALAADELWLEPQWAGMRVQIVRQAADVAVWRDDGTLLNARLPAALLEPVPWPDPCAIEGVLIGWRAGHIVSPWLAAAGAQSARSRRGSPSAGVNVASGGAAASAASMHLVLTDWHRWSADEAEGWTAHERRERLHAQWPTQAAAGAGEAPPAVFTTPSWAPPSRPAVGGKPPSAALAGEAPGGGRSAWNGTLLRRRAARGPHARDAAWAVPAAARRVRAVLQYVPSEALGATAAAALAFAPCGFALWNRSPRTAEERDAAMVASMQGEVAVADEDVRSDDALRLLPLARMPIELPEPQLRAIHAWLREHAGLRFGNVHAVAPALVFEIAFARLRASRRHRLGAVLEEARVVDWLPDAAPGAAAEAAELFAAVASGEVGPST